MTHTTLSSDSSRTRRLALAGVFTALAIVGSFLSFPVAGSKCAPVQHIINILAAVTLGPWYSVGIAFCASLLRNLLGLGSMMAFPGSMVGALCCGLVYSICHKLSLTCLAEALGTGILGGLAAYPVAVYIMGITPAGIFVYVVPFLISTIAGSILAFLLITVAIPASYCRTMLLRLPSKTTLGKSFSWFWWITSQTARRSLGTL